MLFAKFFLVSDKGSMIDWVKTVFDIGHNHCERQWFDKAAHVLTIDHPSHTCCGLAPEFAVGLSHYWAGFVANMQYSLEAKGFAKEEILDLIAAQEEVQSDSARNCAALAYQHPEIMCSKIFESISCTSASAILAAAKSLMLANQIPTESSIMKEVAHCAARYEAIEIAKTDFD
ncbi:hypothetical protein QC760_010512 [Botrytis cinerea]